MSSTESDETYEPDELDLLLRLRVIKEGRVNLTSSIAGKRNEEWFALLLVDTEHQPEFQLYSGKGGSESSLECRGIDYPCSADINYILETHAYQKKEEGFKEWPYLKLRSWRSILQD